MDENQIIDVRIVGTKLNQADVAKTLAVSAAAVLVTAVTAHLAGALVDKLNQRKMRKNLAKVEIIKP